MNSLYNHFMHHFLFILCLLFCVHVLFSISNVKARTVTHETSLSESIPAVIVFGDSTADPGNNNYIPTTFRSNFPPYGRDLPYQIPTGRFTNGRLVSDFVAEYVGVKEYIPPYLDPCLSIEQLMTGVSFASAGSGFDPITSTVGNVISLANQLEYFKEYKAKLEIAIGMEKTQHLIKNALYIITAGTNDFVITYFGLSTFRRKTFDLPSYTDFLILNIREFLQELTDLGARRIGFAGLTPMGCLPIVITYYSRDAFIERDCVEYFSYAARDFNLKLQKELHAMQSDSSYHGSRIAFVDTYKTLDDMIHSQKYGFEEVKRGCCGYLGWVETSYFCNPTSPVCSDPSKYVFWDSVHPTEKAYSLIFHAMKPTIDSFVKG